jgi:hypothetical protein
MPAKKTKPKNKVVEGYCALGDLKKTKQTNYLPL